MDELNDPLSDLKRALVDCIEREGSWDSEAARLAIPPHTLVQDAFPNLILADFSERLAHR